MAKLQLEIVTPEARTFSEEVDMVVLPGVEGELGILPLHVPLDDSASAWRGSNHPRFKAD